MNIFELACGFYEDGLWKGVSKELIRDYMKETLGHIKDSSDATTRIKALMTQTNTFKYLRVFLHRVEMDHHFFPINLT
jgi:hypothetical protein